MNQLNIEKFLKKSLLTSQKHLTLDINILLYAI